MPHAVRRPGRSPLPIILATAILSAFFVFAITAVSVPSSVLGASVTKAAACNANLRTRLFTSARLRATIKTDTRVTVATSVTGGSWRVTCAGKTHSGKYWYRISAINGKSVKTLYGVTYLYAATGLFKPITKYAACNAYLRTSAATTATAKVLIKTDTRVTIATSVTGGSWRLTCAGKALSGKYWYRISAINGKSVKTLYGVTYLYAASGLFKPAASTTASTPAVGSIAFGAYVSGFPSTPSVLDTFDAMVGRPARIVMYYQSWMGQWNAFCDWCADAALARGGQPLVTWEPWVSARSIAAGDHDAYLRTYLHAVAAWGKPLYLRPMHEMNGGWYPWGYGVNGNTAADLIGAFRRIVSIGRAEGATNVRWVWSPNIGQSRVTYNAIYPGDDVVDWLALDGYNWGTSQSWPAWQSLRDVFKPSYDAITALSTRPVMIGETAASELGGDKASWIHQGLLTDLPAVMPRVRAVVWFNENKETDWRVNSSAAALAAYQDVAASTLYRGTLP